ncbi:hypothetical protein ACG33_02440 [Steroidobacter denitrificans]|uniref:Aminoglycoside phosphotransferase domain-containing protein n=1 Tax=Steroidobacter denitrificans TaxID=465721 RepID=A0A127F6H3_STEDE|nr:choline/ethanolamine kinase family protein [Steroidobacter denitrificans]AMN45987.1 hypothetical protein ACG33_02440 [Steroidobacter denitrificans]
MGAINHIAPAVLAAAQVLGLEAAAITSVTDIKHGLTNRSWLVRADGEALVVRLSDAAEDALQIDRASEARILSAVAAAGIGPGVLHCDPDRHILVTRYLGPTWSFEAAGDERNIERLAVLLRRLHRLTPPASVRRVDLTATVEGYWRTLDEHAADAPALHSLRSRARQVAGCLDRDAIACLCHNDVHHLNIVEVPGGDTLRLIDWEYAGIGEPMFDLAAACVYHRHDRARRQRLLAAYLDGVEPAAWHRLELACWLFEYVRELWTAVRELAS